MEFEMNPYVVYVKIDSNNYIIAVNSSAFLADITDWLEVDRGYGDKYHHAQNNYFEKSIITDGCAFRYKLVDGKPVECAEDEIKEQEAAEAFVRPSTEERVEALEAAVMMLCMPDTEEV